LIAPARSSVKHTIVAALASTSVEAWIGRCSSTSFSLVLKSTSEASFMAAEPTTNSVIRCSVNE
jgi:hypothetical protein